MKRVFLCSFALILGSSQYGCTPQEATPAASSGGAQGSSGGAQGSSGGAQGSSGGAQGSSGGAQGSSGGSTGSGGDSTGSGGASSGSGGSGSGGSGTATGGSGSGTGGRANTGGAGGGSSGSGGAGTGTGGSGAGTGGGMGGLPDVPTLFPAGMNGLGSLDGRLAIFPCDETTGGTDCRPVGYYATAGATTAQKINCANSAFDLNQVFPVAGETGKTYTVTIHVYGIAEPHVYTAAGLTRDAGTGRPGNQATGAMPTSWASAAGGHDPSGSDYNTYEIRSCKTRACATADETNVYYLNADTAVGHFTYVMNYEKQIVVTGGGAVRVRNYDRNCRQIKNCDANKSNASDCPAVANARKLTLTSAMPTPGTGFAPQAGITQPQLITERDASNAGQWVLIDVVKVDSVK